MQAIDELKEVYERGFAMIDRGFDESLKRWERRSQERETLHLSD